MSAHRGKADLAFARKSGNDLYEWGATASRSSICQESEAKVVDRQPIARTPMQKPPVCTENLNPEVVVVMESAEDGARLYASGPLNRANSRRVFVQ
jgi:hypothetical protein